MEPLKTFLLGRELASPLVVPAGILGMSSSSLLRSLRAGAGIVTTKTYTVSPRDGHPLPVVAEFPGGLLNAMGLPNPGIEAGLEGAGEYLSAAAAPLIVSVFGSSAEEFAVLARRVESAAAAWPAEFDARRRVFLELNLSCPNVGDEYGLPLAASPAAVGAMVAAAKTSLPVVAKLSPLAPDIKAVARAAVDAGADALALVNTLGPGLLIDTEFRRPILSNRFGGVSGPAIKPLALRLVYECAGAVSVPIIGMGGVSGAEDAVEMLMAGATLVGVGTAVYDHGLEVLGTINTGLAAWLGAHGVEGMADFPRLEPCRV